MNFLLSEEQEMMRNMVRDFIVNEIAPTAGIRDEEESRDIRIWNKRTELGLTGNPSLL
jgi:alkylation response protein AidB-like acyl-CoA dehydrogenase